MPAHLMDVRPVATALLEETGARAAEYLRRRGRRPCLAGNLIPLDEQDRGVWDATAIARGIGLLNDSLQRTEGTANAYQPQAAIADEHARAGDYHSTNWPEVVRVSDLLLTVAPPTPHAWARRRHPGLLGRTPGLSSARGQVLR